jgi:ketosteroid isomerase-like protein
MVDKTRGIVHLSTPTEVVVPPTTCRIGLTLIGSLAAAACSRPAGDDRASLMAADREFERATDARGAAGWTSFYAADAVTISPRSQLTRGAAAIGAAAERDFADSTTRLRWQPEFAEASRGGDLGYTYGRWQFLSFKSRADSAVVARGRYVTIWRRQRDGSWKVLLDTGSEERQER